MTTCSAGFGLSHLSNNCELCWPGTFSSGGLNAVCDPVPEGHYNSGYGESQYYNCSFSLLKGAAVCLNTSSTPCEAGKFFNSTLSSCAAVQTGYYNPIAGSNMYYYCEGSLHEGAAYCSQDSWQLECPRFEVSGTDFAHKNYSTCSFQLCPGQSVTASGCGSANQDCQVNDQFFALFDGAGNYLASSDDFCGYCSQVTYSLPESSSCQTVTLREGCYDLSSCYGVPEITYNSQCLPGTYHNGARCELAPVGYYAPDSNSSTFYYCSNSIELGAASCHADGFNCSAGQVFDSNSNQCKNVKSNYYNPYAGSNVEYYCPIGSQSGASICYSVSPSSQPTGAPTITPVSVPTSPPSSFPTIVPTAAPTEAPFATPTGRPSVTPTACPTSRPTLVPSCEPSSTPSTHPTAFPSVIPSSQPTGQPIGQPSSTPTALSYPKLLTATFNYFADKLNLVFDFPTNQSPANQFPCDVLLSFDGSTNANCRWISSTLLEAALLPPLLSSLRIGSVVFLRADMLKRLCSNCFAVSPEQSLAISPAADVLTPTLALSHASVATVCDYFFINVAASGQLGRSWSRVTWNVTAESTNATVLFTAAAIATYLSSFNPPATISIPQDLLLPAAFNLSVTVENVAGGSSTGASVVLVSSNLNIPVITSFQPSAAAINVNQPFSGIVSATLPSCADLDTVLEYTWELKQVDVNGLISTGLTSTSRDRRKFYLPSYSLSSETSYVLFLKIQSLAPSQSLLGSAVDSFTVSVVDGPVIAVISGGGVRSAPVFVETFLDASASYDSNSQLSMLHFEWTCDPLVGFPASCDFIRNLPRNNSTLRLPAASLKSGQTVRFEVKVTVGSRWGNSSVTIHPVNTSTTVLISGQAKENFDRKLVLISRLEIFNPVEAVWTVRVNSTTVSQAAQTPQRANFSATDLPTIASFPIAYAANSFPAGTWLTFRLVVCDKFGSQFSFSEISVTINGPPHNGVTTVSPQSGVSLQTDFLLSAFGWVDNSDDYPLYYKFNYELSSVSPKLAISSFSGNSYVQTVLPSGLASMQFNVTITGTAADKYGASANASLAVTVLEQTVTDYESILTASLNAFESSLDADSFFQIGNIVTSAINANNCSTSPDCETLNRRDCSFSGVPQTCGSCLPSFTGVVGSSNSICRSSSSEGGAVGSTCTTSSDCLYGLCEGSVCVTPSKQCPSNDLTKTCSGHGSCGFVDMSGRNVTACLLTEPFCYARCSCFLGDGFGGVDCSLNTTELAKLDRTRSTLCSNLLSVAIQQDKTSEVMSTLIRSLSEMFDPSEVRSDSGVQACSSVLEYLAVLSIEGYLSEVSSSDVQYLLETISSFVSLPGSGVAVNTTLLVQALDAVTASLSNNMVGGEEAMSLVTDNIRMTVASPQTDSLQNISISPPLTEAEAAYGSLPPTIDFPGEGLQQCGFSGGYAGLSIMQWGQNPYPNSSSLESPILQFSTASSGGRRLSSTGFTFPATDAAPAYFVTLQFASMQSFNFSQFKNMSEFNVTFPDCSYYDGSQFTSCDGCNVSSFTNLNVTFACYDISILCLSASGGRLLQTTEEKQTASYATLLVSVARELQSVLSHNPFELNLQSSKSILIFVSLLTFTILAGTLYFSRRDAFQHNKATYVVEPGQTKQRKKLQIVEVLEQVGVELRFLRKIDREEEKKKAARKGLVPMLGRSASGSVELSYLINEFLDIALPKRLLLSGNILARFLECVYHYHDYWAFLSNGTNRLNKTMRWLGLCRNVLIAFFVDTLFFGIFFPDDSTCPMFTTESTCLSLPSKISPSSTLCEWSEQSLSCALKPPPSSLLFTILLALVCTFIQLPLQVGLQYVMEEYGAKRPSLEQINLNSANWLGSAFQEEAKNKSSLLKDVMDQTDTQELTSAETTAFGLRVYSDYLSAEEECSDILKHLRKIYCVDVETPAALWGSAGPDNVLDARARAIIAGLGLYPDGSPIPMTLLTFLGYGSSERRIISDIKSYRSSAKAIAKRLSVLSESDGEKDKLLVQIFVLERIPLYARYPLWRYFNLNERIQENIDAISWILVWACIILCFVFFIYWIFAWGVQNGGRTVANWALNFGVSALQDVFVVQPLKIFILFVMSIEAIRPQLRAIRQTLNKIALSFSCDGLDVQLGFSVIQHTSPSCRAARMHFAHDLPAGFILRRVTDEDVENCRSPRRLTIGLMVFIAVSMVATVAVFNEDLGDTILDLVNATLFSGFVIANDALLAVDVAILVALYLALLGFVLYQYGFLSPVVDRLRRYQMQRAGFRSSLRRGRETEFAFGSFAKWFLPFTDAISENRSRITTEMWRKMNVSNRSEFIEELKAVETTSTIEEDMKETFCPQEILGMVSGAKTRFEASDYLTRKLFSATRKIPNCTETVCMANYATLGDEFRHELWTDDIYQALAYLFRDHPFKKFVSAREMPKEEYFATYVAFPADMDWVIDRTVLETKFKELWAIFWPGGFPLSQEQQNDAHAIFLEWAAEACLWRQHQPHFVRCADFRDWFVEFHDVILRLRALHDLDLSERTVIL